MSYRKAVEALFSSFVSFILNHCAEVSERRELSFNRNAARLFLDLWPVVPVALLLRETELSCLFRGEVLFDRVWAVSGGNDPSVVVCCVVRPSSSILKAGS